MTVAEILAAYRHCKFLVTFSGGKDSVATWLHLERDLGLDVLCLFANTGFESDVTYEYISRLEREFSLPLVRVVPKVRHIWIGDPPARIPREHWDDPIDMKRMVELKGRPPGAKSRFCTTILKLRPMRDFVAEVVDELVIAAGVRAEESEKRANMDAWGFDDFMGRYRWLPIQGWTAAQVFECHDRHGVPPNPLYLKGCSRVGCWPCIFARKAELAVIAKDEPARERLKSIEASSGRTFFPRKMVSLKYRSKIDPKTRLRICTADDVFRWATEQQPAFKEDSMFAGEEVPLDYGDDLEAESCSSVYGLCE